MYIYVVYIYVTYTDSSKLYECMHTYSLQLSVTEAQPCSLLVNFIIVGKFCIAYIWKEIILSWNNLYLGHHFAYVYLDIFSLRNDTEELKK